MKKLILLIVTILSSAHLGLSAQTEEQQDQNNKDITIHSDIRLERLLAKKLAINKENNMVAVYRIQLYSGTRSGSKASMNKIKSILGNQYANVTYDQPNFKTKVGAYRTEMEAEKQLKILKEDFPLSFVLKEEIPFKELIKKRNNTIGTY